jgi:hypothetical protein
MTVEPEEGGGGGRERGKRWKRPTGVVEAKMASRRGGAGRRH